MNPAVSCKNGTLLPSVEQTLRGKLPFFATYKSGWDTCRHRYSAKGWLVVQEEGLAQLWRKIWIAVNMWSQILPQLKLLDMPHRYIFPEISWCWVLASVEPLGEKYCPYGAASKTGPHKFGGLMEESRGSSQLMWECATISPDKSHFFCPSSTFYQQFYTSPCKNIYTQSMSTQK